MSRYFLDMFGFKWPDLPGPESEVTPSPLNIVTSCPCEFWFDGQDASAIALNGNRVIQWDDKSGNANHLAQAVDAQRPTYDPATGRLTFVNANNTYLSNTSIALTQPNTIFILCRSTNAIGVNRTFFDGITTRQLLIHGFAGNGWQFYAGAAVDNVAVDLNDHIFAIEFNGAASFLWADGITNGALNPGANNLTDFVLGANSTFGNWADGEIMELFGYDCQITAAERTALDNYLITKWSL